MLMAGPDWLPVRLHRTAQVCSRGRRSRSADGTHVALLLPGDDETDDAESAAHDLVERKAAYVNTLGMFFPFGNRRVGTKVKTVAWREASRERWCSLSGKAEYHAFGSFASG